MLTLIPDLHVNNEFYHENVFLNLAQQFEEMGVKDQLLIVDEDADEYAAQLDLLKCRVIYLFDKILAVADSGAGLTLADLHLDPKYMLKTVLYSNAIIVRVYDNQNQIMQINMDANGRVKLVSDFRKAGQLTAEHYDTRGFCSSRSLYQGEKLVKKQWFDPASNLVMTQTEDESIIIAPKAYSRFKQKNYSSLAAVIAEFARPYLPAGRQLLAEPNAKTLRLSLYLAKADFHYYFTNELQLVNNDFAKIRPQDHYLFQNETLQNAFLGLVKHNGLKFVPNCGIIPPYFIDFSLGNSMELKMQAVYWHVGEITDAALIEIFQQLFKLLKQNKLFKIIVDASSAQKELLQGLLKKLSAGFKKKKAASAALNDAETVGLQVSAVDRFIFPKRLTAAERLRLLKSAHLFLDTDVMTDFTLQLEAVKLGIPQVVRQANGLVKEGQNGVLLRKNTQVMQALLLFLNDLAKWNGAVVENVSLIEQLAPETILKKWLKEVENE